MNRIIDCSITGAKTAIKVEGSVPLEVTRLRATNCENLLEYNGHSSAVVNHVNETSPPTSLNANSVGWTRRYSNNYDTINWQLGSRNLMKFTDVTTDGVDHFYVGPENAPLEVQKLYMKDGKSVVKINNPNKIDISTRNGEIELMLPPDFKSEELTRIIFIIKNAKEKGEDPVRAVGKDPIWSRWLSQGAEIASIAQLASLFC